MRGVGGWRIRARTLGETHAVRLTPPRRPRWLIGLAAVLVFSLPGLSVLVLKLTADGPLPAGAGLTSAAVLWPLGGGVVLGALFVVALVGLVAALPAGRHRLATDGRRLRVCESGRRRDIPLAEARGLAAVDGRIVLDEGWRWREVVGKLPAAVAEEAVRALGPTAGEAARRPGPTAGRGWRDGWAQWWGSWLGVAAIAAGPWVIHAWLIAPAQAAHAWPAVPAVVEALTIGGEPGKPAIDVRYRYSAGGRSHVGERVGFYRDVNEAAMNELADSLAVGGTVAADVDPADPTRATLLRGAHAGWWMFIGVVGVFGVLLVVVQFAEAAGRVRGYSTSQ